MDDLLTLFRPTQALPRYGSVLLPLGSARATQPLIRAAVTLANQLGARLVGLACSPVDGLIPTTAAEQDAVQLLFEAAGEGFEALTGEVRAGRRWRRCAEPLFDALHSNGWSADLVLLKHSDVVTLSSRTRLRRLMRRTSLPVLIWPDAAPPRLVSRAAVLCDQSPASLHVLRAAAPILSRCSTVFLVGAGRHVVDVKRGLEEQGTPEVVQVHLEPALSHIAAQLLTDAGADLVVVGAWPEFLAGWPARSVTDLLLGDARTPVFLAR